MKTIKYVASGILLALAVSYVLPVSQERLYPTGFNSIEICDRNGVLLREVLSFDYKTSMWVPLEDITPWMMIATIMREDKRFLFHQGVDVLALARAMWQNARHGHILSGGSTITMQVAKMALNLRGRSVLKKILEIAYAFKLELHLTKAQILEIYLNRVPYGNQTYGIGAAARFYFGKSGSQLSLSESCALAVLPKAPSKLNPYVACDLLLTQRNRYLRQLRERKLIDDLRYKIALREPMNLVDREINFEAPHFVDYILARLDQGMTGASRITTTLDGSLQNDVQKFLVSTLRSLREYNVNQGAVLVMSIERGEILAMVGSRDYFDAKEGQVNGCLSPRQPGSSIKPFLYALALQSGMRSSDILPDTVIEFRLADGTSFAPRNYSNRYHGPTRLREALASSLNVPAVYLVERLGIQRFYELLQQLRFSSLDKGSHHYGLSLGLGAAEVSLLELVNAYRTFALKGLVGDINAIRAVQGGRNATAQTKKETVKRVFSEEVAYLITDILSDNAGRFKAFDSENALHLPFSCAVKTGTSKDYRDNWCIGYTTDYVVGVWVGNFNGAPMQGVSGISGAAPLMRNVILELYRNFPPRNFERPPSVVQRQICANTGKMPSSQCPKLVEETFIDGTEPYDTCDIHSSLSGRPLHALGPSQANSRQEQVRILNPLSGDIYKIDPQVSRLSQYVKFVFAADEARDAIKISLNGEQLAILSSPYEYLWQPAPGHYTLEASSNGNEPQESDRISFTVH